MNISQPISSVIDSVDFTLLTGAEVKAISVKRIENPTTFDSLLNPTPHGLYDPALGAWGDSLCATCNLGPSSCPGHVGHIDLPVPVYHPVFLDQIMLLMRAQCVYCHRVRMRRADLTLYACKLRLLQFGLLGAASELDNISIDTTSESTSDEDEGDGPTSDKSALDKLVRLREAFTRRMLKGHKIATADIRKGKHEGAADARRQVIKDLLKDMVKRTPCYSCGGLSPTYRKDRFVKIFEKPLSTKDSAKMAQMNLKVKNALTLTQNQKLKKNKKHLLDEGIADVDETSSEDDGRDDIENEEGNREDEDGEELDENGDVIMQDASIKTSAPKRASKNDAPQRYVGTLEVLARLSILFEKEQEILSLLYNSRPAAKAQVLTPDMFFLKTILVPPNKYRPEARQGDGAIAEAQQNSLYKQILDACTQVALVHRDIGSSTHNVTEAKSRVAGLHGNIDDISGTDSRRRRRNMTDLHEATVRLQDCVNSLIDRDRNPIRGAAGKRNEDGIKQKLEKKEGLFRKNMMGKRVNYAARSVISPDPNIETNEIGVPPVFARKLTFPEPVTSHNFREMQQAVINGVDKWPGAAAIENENGQIVNLRNKSQDERVALANQLLAPSSQQVGAGRSKKVHRHLGNGDVVLMNRQPTLHKPSIMGHRVRVLPGEKTIRMHYANCNTYNADFDGDEMNMHFPQNEIARAEAMQVADTDHQYLSYTAGKPLRGLIQDHLSVSVSLCNKDTFFDRSSYQELVYNALRPEHGQITTEKIELVAPAIFKPVRRWTGKQVVTTILKNIKPAGHGNLWLTRKSQVDGKRWGENSEEGVVVVHDGEFISGILDKAHLGPSTGGFIHSIHEIWGPSSAARLLSSMGRLLTKYLHMRAFTCGMDDLILTPEGENLRKERLKAADLIGLEVAAKYVSLDQRTDIESTDPTLLERLEEVMRDDNKQEGLDLLMNQASKDVSGGVTNACLPAGLVKQFPKNHMQTMTVSGAKGSAVNANLISCNLGQQVLEGRRVPLMVSGKSLPCFRPYETNVRAGGYIVNRFLTGIRPQEYYFHHMAGREGLIDTAVKTSRSGYLQRCLIKGMEGLRVAYDSSVRDSDGSMIQFLYGEDGLDITKQKYLEEFGFVLRNRDSEIEQLGIAERGWEQDIFQSKEYALKYTKKAVKEAKAGNANARDPILGELNPNRNAFSTSEKFFEKVTDYLKVNPEGLIKEKGNKDGEDHRSGVSLIPRKYAELVFHNKYLSSLVEPGEAVGIVAGQSVGEPSTQMTLNTFHLAGHSAKNVTLGIPRLREILMTASDHISTPSMTLVLNEELSEEAGEQFAKAISVLPLSHVVDRVTVKERVGKGTGHRLAKMYNIRLDFFPSKEYCTTYAISIADVLATVENKLLDLLGRLVKKEIKTKSSHEDSAARPEIGVKAGDVEMESSRPGMGAVDGGHGGGNEDDEDDDDDGDDDATNSKARANRSEAVSYGPNDDDDDDIQRRMARDVSPEDADELEDEGYAGSPVVGAESEDETEPKDANTTAGLNRSREARVKEKNAAVSDFACDETDGRWCDFTLEYDAGIPKVLMLSLVQHAVRKTVIQQIEGVGQCTFVAKDDDFKIPVVHTVGVNLPAMQKYGDFINPNRIHTNDIAAVLSVYGVEAARNNIIGELSKVFGSHGIGVDNRHLNLIGDYMTRNGGFTAFSRMGLRGNVSPFTKMSFETTLAFLKDAVLDGDWDDLSTPSGRLVMGKVGKVGTGAFDVLTRVHAKNGKHQL